MRIARVARFVSFNAARGSGPTLGVAGMAGNHGGSGGGGGGGGGGNTKGGPSMRVCQMRVVLWFKRTSNQCAVVVMAFDSPAFLSFPPLFVLKLLLLHHY